jgi:hypothetical protein
MQSGNSFILSRKETASTIELTFDESLNTELIRATDDSTMGWYSPSFMNKQKSSVILASCKSTQPNLTLTTYIKIINHP